MFSGRLKLQAVNPLSGDNSTHYKVIPLPVRTGVLAPLEMGTWGYFTPINFGGITLLNLPRKWLCLGVKTTNLEG